MCIRDRPPLDRAQPAPQLASPILRQSIPSSGPGRGPTDVTSAPDITRRHFGLLPIYTPVPEYRGNKAKMPRHEVLERAVRDRRAPIAGTAIRSGRCGSPSRSDMWLLSSIMPPRDGQTGRCKASRSALAPPTRRGGVPDTPRRPSCSCRRKSPRPGRRRRDASSATARGWRGILRRSTGGA